MANPNRKNNYRRLREVGFSYKEAQKYKDHSQTSVEVLITKKMEQNYIDWINYNKKNNHLMKVPDGKEL